uniref:Uncharacterized protein n=1 Tax=viral metagenome TaxID=1070528 RepID=A0A6C0KJ22_9ZZZZ
MNQMNQTNQMNQIDKYMLTNKRTINILRHDFYNSIISKKFSHVKPILIPKKNNFFIPHHNDTLFWCFYVIQKSIEDYELISLSGFKEEHEYKIKFIEKIKKEKSMLKENKIKYTEIEDDMINKKNIGINSIKALCLSYKINCMIIKNKSYIDINGDINGDSDGDSDGKIHIIQCMKNKYMIAYVHKDKIDYYKTNLLSIPSFTKPLKSVSAYTLDTLKTMCLKLDISIYKNEGKTKLKKELYESILKELLKIE